MIKHWAKLSCLVACSHLLAVACTTENDDDDATEFECERAAGVGCVVRPLRREDMAGVCAGRSAQPPGEWMEVGRKSAVSFEAKGKGEREGQLESGRLGRGSGFR